MTAGRVLVQMPACRIIVSKDTFCIVPVRGSASAKRIGRFGPGWLRVGRGRTFGENRQARVACRISVGYDDRDVRDYQIQRPSCCSVTRR